MSFPEQTWWLWTCVGLCQAHVGVKISTADGFVTFGSPLTPKLVSYLRKWDNKYSPVSAAVRIQWSDAGERSGRLVPSTPVVGLSAATHLRR